MANQSHVVLVGAELSEVCRKDCAQFGTQTDRKGKVSCASARRKKTETRRDRDNFLPDPHIFIQRVLVHLERKAE